MGCANSKPSSKTKIKNKKEKLKKKHQQQQQQQNQHEQARSLTSLHTLSQRQRSDEPNITGLKNAVLLSRAQANKLARILFLRSRARPIVHASSKMKNAYFVSKQLADGVTEECVSPNEIKEILENFNGPFIFHETTVTSNSDGQLSSSNENITKNSSSIAPCNAFDPNSINDTSLEYEEQDQDYIVLENDEVITSITNNISSKQSIHDEKNNNGMLTVNTLGSEVTTVVEAQKGNHF